MDILQRVPMTDLARNTRKVIKAVQRGQAAVVENHGEPEVAIIDIIDYFILRATLRHYLLGAEIEPPAGLFQEEVDSQADDETRFNLVIGRYLAGAISLAKAAELLGFTWLDMRSRCQRLDVPLRIGPAGAADVAKDAETIRKAE